MSRLVKELHDIPFVPILTIKNFEDVEPLTDSLVRAGVRVFEITLRTDAAIPAIQFIKEKYPEVLVGVGTILNERHYQQVIERTPVDFVVSPGSTKQLLKLSAQHSEIPFLLGVFTATEIMEAYDYGHNLFKFFPSHGLKGIDTLESWAPVFPDIKFFPTSGIDLENATQLLQLNNVLGVGGNWMAPDEHIENKNWQAIFHLTQETIETLKPIKQSNDNTHREPLTSGSLISG